VSELLDVALRSGWTFLGSCVFLLLGGFSIALSFYWLTRYREFRHEEGEREKAQRLYETISEIISRKPPFN